VDTSQIESMIDDCCTDMQEDPDLHELLATVADRQGVSASENDLAQGARFVAGYIHQVPYMMKVAWIAASKVGLMLWLIMEPAFGKRIAWMTLFAIAAVTIIGFEFSERFLPYAGDGLIAGVQAVIIGTIIHSLIHRGHVHRHHEEH